MIDRIGHYRVLRRLGEGGMGVVYAALDERLDRPVALKWMRSALTDAVARERFMREARAAASVSHPHICPIYALDEFDGRLCIAMELLEGRSLVERLSEGPFGVAEAHALTHDVLEALGVLHSRGLVHRDLKPSNVFLTSRGPVLLDFGLARDLREGAGAGLTQTGTVIGTPSYMAPEQALGKPVDGRTDVFAAGLLLYEMLAGRPAFSGDSVVAILYAIVNTDPRPLDTEGAGRYEPVLARALAKSPTDRYPDAAAMAAALRSAADRSGDGPGASSGAAGRTGSPDSTARGRNLTRLLVLPLRVVRPDPETDYLAYSLPDAAATSLAGLESLVVRPSATAARFAQYPLDLERIAREADVDVVLSGTLMRSGERVRVNCQLIEVPAGTLIVSHTCEAPLDDLFRLEDDLCRRVVEALRLPLTAREHRLLGRDVPVEPRAYAAYLKANQLMTETQRWGEARDLYLEAVRADPHYAPAWARLGRAHRVLAKYGDEVGGVSGYTQAAEAFHRALELNPDLPAAHHLVTHLEVETGRAREAVERLLGRIRDRRTDPELYAGLVTALRFSGLLDESLQAYEVARRLDPFVSTSVAYTLFMRGDYERAMAADEDNARFVTAHSLAATGRLDEATRVLRETERATTHRTLKIVVSLYLAAIRGDPSETRAAAAAQKTTAFRDPEGFFLVGRCLAHVGAHDEALVTIHQAITDGFACATFLQKDSWFASLRERPEFPELLARAEAVRERAHETFMAAGGDRLLGTYASRSR